MTLRRGERVVALAIAIGLVARASFADEPTYDVYGGSLVVRDGGRREDVPTGCKSASSIVRRGDELFIACGAEGLAIFSLEGGRPTPKQRVEARAPCVRVYLDGHDVRCDDPDGALAWLGAWTPPAQSAARAPAIEPLVTVPAQADVYHQRRRWPSGQSVGGTLLVLAGLVQTTFGVVILASNASSRCDDNFFGCTGRDVGFAFGGVVLGGGILGLGAGLYFLTTAPDSPLRSGVARATPERAPIWVTSFPRAPTSFALGGSF